jgi:hypothetical protein
VNEITVLLSMVSDEFSSYRTRLRGELTRLGVSVKVQEDFKASGTTTLVKLDDVIRHCDAVVHVVGDMTGSFAGRPAVADVCARHADLTTRSDLRPLGEAIEASSPLSYTQWEAYLAIYHGKTLLIAAAEPQAVREGSFVEGHGQIPLQRAHVERLGRLGHFAEIRFKDAETLIIGVLESSIFDMVLAARQHARAARDFAKLRTDYARAVVDFCRLERVGFDVKASNPFSSSSFAASLAPLAARDAFAGQRFVPHQGDSRSNVGINGLRGDHLVIVGVGGAGKSSVLKQILVRTAESDTAGLPFFVPAAAESGTAKTPIFVPLTRLPPEGALTTARLVEHLSDQARTDLGFPEAGRDFFEKVLDEGAVVGFDALDECGPVTRRQQVRDLIVDVARKWPKCRIVVTSRIDTFAITPLPLSSDSGEQTTPSFTLYELAPFTRNDVAAFLKVAFDDPGPLAEEILEKTGIEALIQTPLTLTLLALVARGGGGLPSNRTDLFRSCVETVTGTWEEPKGRASDGLQPAQRVDVLQSLGWEAQRRGVDALTAHEGRSAISRFSELHSTSLAKNALDWLSRRSVLVRPELASGASTELRRLTFTHLQFREYLAGAYLADRLATDSQSTLREISGRWLDSTWLGVFRFAVGTLQEAPELIDATLEAAFSASDPWRDLLHRPEFLTAHLLVEVDDPDAARVGLVVQSLARLARDEPALREEAADTLLSLWRYPAAVSVIERWARGVEVPESNLALDVSASDETSGNQDRVRSDARSVGFKWRLKAIHSLAKARGSEAALPILAEMHSQDSDAELAIREAQARLGDFTGAVARLRDLFDASSPYQLGAVVDQIGASSYLNAWISERLAASNELDIHTAFLARSRGLLSDTGPQWTTLFERARFDLAKQDPANQYDSDDNFQAMVAAAVLCIDTPLPAARALLRESLRHRSHAWFAGPALITLDRGLADEVVRAMMVHLTNPEPIDQRNDSLYNVMLRRVLCNDPDDALVVPSLLQLLSRLDIVGRSWVFVAESLRRRGHADPALAVLRAQIDVPPGVDDHHRDDQGERRSRALSAADYMAPGSTRAWLDSLYRASGDERANAQRLTSLWEVSGLGTLATRGVRRRPRAANSGSRVEIDAAPDVSRIMDRGAVALQWFEGIAADDAGQAFLDVLAAHASATTFGKLAHLALTGRTLDEAAATRDGSPPTLAELESRIEWLLDEAADSPRSNQVLTILESIKEIGGPEAARGYSDRWLRSGLADGKAPDAEAAGTLAVRLMMLSSVDIRDPHWVDLAASVARHVAPAERIGLIAWIRQSV